MQFQQNSCNLIYLFSTTIGSTVELEVGLLESIR